MIKKLLELVFDEENPFAGVEAISLVENPAIQEDWIFLNKEGGKKPLYDIKLADKEKRLILGAALIPDKKILRKDKDGGDDFEVFFSAETIRKVSQAFLIRGKQGNSTLEHSVNLGNVTVVESWIVEDAVHDKSRKFGMDVPVGTWMLSMRVDDDVVWNEWVKEGRVNGFSIEGKFADSMKIAASSDEDKLNQIINILKQFKD